MQSIKNYGGLTHTIKWFKKIRIIREPIYWQKALPFLVFLLLTLVFHFREIFFGEFHLFSDRIHLMGRYVDIFANPYPWKTFQWTENVHFGFSWAREMGSVFFHFPENILMCFLNPFQAIIISTLFYYLISQIFTYLYLRSFNCSQVAAIIGAVVFTFSGSISLQVSHYAFFIIALLTPLLFWLAESLARNFRLSYAVVIILVLANNFFAIHPQYFIYQVLALIIYFSVRVLQLFGLKKGILRVLTFLSLFLIAILLAAPYILPFRDQMLNSVTSQGRSYGDTSILDVSSNLDLSSRWSRLMVLFYSLFTPKAVGSDATYASIPSLVEHSWIWGVYMGVFPWFCLSGLRKLRHRAELIPLVIISFLALLFFVPNLFVPFLPDLRVLHQNIPLLNKFHLIERFLFLGVFSTSMLLAFSLDSWSQDPKKLDMLFPIILLLLLGGIFVSSALFQWKPDWLPSVIYNRLQIFAKNSGRNYIIHTIPGSAASILLLLSFALAASRVWLKLPRPIFLTLALVLIASDLIYFGLLRKPTLETKNFLFPPKLAQNIPQNKRFINVSFTDSWAFNRDINPKEAYRSLDLSFNLFCGLSSTGGFTWPVMSKEEYTLFNLMLANVPVQGPFYERKITNTKQLAGALNLWRLYSIEYLITDRDINIPGLILVTQDDKYRLYKILDSLPRIYCASDIHIVNNNKDLFNQLKEKQKKNLKECIVVNQGLKKENIEVGNGIVTGFSKTNTDMTINVKADKKGAFLVITDRWTKEWKSTIDKIPAKLYRVNGMQRGLFVPPGLHVVKLHYYDHHLILGLYLSGFTLLLLVAFCVRANVNKWVIFDAKGVDLSSSTQSLLNL